MIRIDPRIEGSIDPPDRSIRALAIDARASRLDADARLVSDIRRRQTMGKDRSTQRNGDPSDDSGNFFIVGVGASAGGLEALEEFFRLRKRGGARARQPLVDDTLYFL